MLFKLLYHIINDKLTSTAQQGHRDKLQKACGVMNKIFYDSYE